MLDHNLSALERLVFTSRAREHMRPARSPGRLRVQILRALPVLWELVLTVHRTFAPGHEV